MTGVQTCALPISNVRIAISNFGGNSPGITTGFGSRGVAFIDMNRAPAVPSPATRIYLTKESVLSFSKPTSDGVAAHNDRSSRAAAYAEGARVVSQLANDARCPVPCDHIPVRSWPLFRARDVLRGVIESFKQEKIQ